MDPDHQPLPGTNANPDEDFRPLLEIGLSETMQEDSTGEGDPVSVAGMQIGDYEVIDELGRGGMGVVYRARQRSLNRVVALKMILAASFASKTQRLRFFREAELIASLRHPNVVAIHEIGEHEGQPYYSMDFIEGAALKDLIKDGSIAWAEAARLAQTIAQAMQVAHDHGVVHRDLKPQNILVDRLRHPHVADFGLARDLNADHGLTMTGDVVGTPNYMSPEQSRGSEEITAATDIYAIGAILYEMLTSISPFRGGSLPEILENIRNKEPIAPRLLNPSIPRDLDTVCLKCLEKDPARRYQTAGELAEELDRVLRDIPIRAKPIGRVEQGLRWCRRNRTIALVVAGATSLLAVTIIIAFFVQNVERLKAERAQAQAEKAQVTAEQEKTQATTALSKLEQANSAILEKNKELENYVNEITHQKGVISSFAKTDAERDLSHAVELFQELHLPDAQTATDKILGDHPEMPDAWYLAGQLALAQGKLATAKKNLEKARDLSTGGLDAAGEALLGLVAEYAAAPATPDAPLTGEATLKLLENLRGKPEYFAFVQGQQHTRDLLLQLIRSALAVDNGGTVTDGDNLNLVQQGKEIILELKNIPMPLDLSEIKKYPIFTGIHLENVALADLSPFAGMPLSRVELLKVPVSSLAPLKGMPIESLLLQDTSGLDLEPLRDAPLRSLTLVRSPCPAQDLLQHWPLATLVLSDTSLPKTFTVPKGISTLALVRVGLTDVSFVASAASSLTSLDLTGNSELLSVEPLRSMTNLHHLDLADTHVTSVEPLAGLNLESLSLRNTFVGQISSLKNLPLQELDLSGCLILDLDSLPKKPAKLEPPKPLDPSKNSPP